MQRAYLDEGSEVDGQIVDESGYYVRTFGGWMLDDDQTDETPEPVVCVWCDESYPDDEIAEHRESCSSRPLEIGL